MWARRALFWLLASLFSQQSWRSIRSRFDCLVFAMMRTVVFHLVTRRYPGAYVLTVVRLSRYLDRERVW